MLFHEGRTLGLHGDEFCGMGDKAIGNEWGCFLFVGVIEIKWLDGIDGWDEFNGSGLDFRSQEF